MCVAVVIWSITGMNDIVQIKQIKAVNSLDFEEEKKRKEKSLQHAWHERKSYQSCLFIRSKAMLFALVSSFSVGPSEVVYL